MNQFENIDTETPQSNLFCLSSDLRPNFVSSTSECSINSNSPNKFRERGRQRQRNCKLQPSSNNSSDEIKPDSHSEDNCQLDPDAEEEKSDNPDASLSSSRSSSGHSRAIDIQSLYSEMMAVRKKKMEADLAVSRAENRLVCEGTATTGVSCGTDPDDEFNEDEELTDVWGRPILSNSCIGTEDEHSTNNPCPNTATMSIQVDPLKSFLENKIIPFVNDHHRSEYRINGKLKPEALKTLKSIANERELLIRYFGKGRNQYAAIRKKASLWNRQQDYLKWKADEGKRKKLMEEEARRLQEEEAARKKIEEEKARKAALIPKTMEICVQIDCDVEEGKVDPKMAGVIGPVPKGARGPPIETCMQTCEEGVYTCPYCEEELPEEIRLMHHPICLAQHRAKMVALNKQNRHQNQFHNNKDKRTSSGQQHRLKSNPRPNRSKSRSNIELIDPKSELEQIPQNDINRMVKVLRHLDTHCVVKTCDSKGETCDNCRRSYCELHDSGSCHPCKSPHPVSSKPLSSISSNPPPQNGLMILHRLKKRSQRDQDSHTDCPDSPPRETDDTTAESATTGEPVEVEPGVLRFSNKEDYRKHLKKNLRHKLSQMAARRS